MASWTKTKRTISPHPPLSTKKLKSEDAVGKCSSPPPIDLLDQPSPPNGVERICFDTFGPRRGDPSFRQFYCQKVTERRDALARIGRKVVGRISGIWFDDGVALHWVADHTLKTEALGLPTNDIFVASTKAGVDDTHLFVFKADRKHKRSANEAILISDSEDEQGLMSAPSESSKGTSLVPSSRYGSLTSAASSSHGIFSRNLSEDISSLAGPKLIASGFSPLIQAPHSDVDMVLMTEALPCSEGGHILPNITQDSAIILQPHAPSSIHTNVSTSSDMERDNAHDGNKLPKARPTFPRTNEELTAPMAVRNTSSTVPNVESAMPILGSNWQSMQLQKLGPPGLLEKVFVSDCDDAFNEVESLDGTSSDDDRPIALAKAVATPLRELLPRRPHLDLNDSDSDTLGPPMASRDTQVPLSVRPDNDTPTSVTGYRVKTRIRQRRSESTDSNSERQPSALFSQPPKAAPKRLPKSGYSMLSANRATFKGPRVASSSSTDRTGASSTILPKAANGKARRVLVPETPDLPLTTISMRADANFLDRNQEYYSRISRWSIPNQGEYRHVEDAVIIGDTVVVGYDDSPCQVSIIPLKEDVTPRVLDLSHKPHTTLGSSGTKTKRGVSCVAPVQSNSTNLRFASGGYDKRVYLWTVADDGSSPVSTSVPIVHSSFVQALVYRPSDHCLMSGAGSRLHRTNLRHIHPPKDFRLSNVLHHIHIHPQEPNLTILEVNHLDHQIQIFDKRRGEFDRAACLQFGYRALGSKPESRYSRGSAHFNLFVKGYIDGTVRLFDYRNVQKVSVRMQRRPSAEAIIHTVFSGSKIVAFGGHVIDFWAYNT